MSDVIGGWAFRPGEDGAFQGEERYMCLIRRDDWWCWHAEFTEADCLSIPVSALAELLRRAGWTVTPPTKETP